MFSRCRIGLSHLTHFWLLTIDDMPKCIACNVQRFTMIFLSSASTFSQSTLDTDDNKMNTLFATVRPEAIIDYIIETGLYNKL